MMGIFARKTANAKSPSELVRTLRDILIRLAQLDPPPPNYQPSARSTTLEHVPVLNTSPAATELRREASKTLTAIRAVLYGESDQEPSTQALAELANEAYSNDIFYLLLLHMGSLEFEARKDVAQIFSHLLRRQIGERLPTVETLRTKPEVIRAAMNGYRQPEIALNTGMILREMIRHEPLAKMLLYSDQFYDFIGYIERTTFGIACDAMLNFKDTLTKHKEIVAEYLDAHYDEFFGHYQTLIDSDNYVTQRQSIKLLGDLLLDKKNYKIMIRYVSSEDNLKTMMNLLRHRSKNIQFEAFHVFKVFAANPSKPPKIANILKRNKDGLIVFLRNFRNDTQDPQFIDEKQYLLQSIQAL
ncbi:uncharacterized protein L969DRAFT_101198 [Mixia osmundae IAM 14324]|uniref:Uncharacterized protein n=1 Tax=Mixia osmundae (strain CBS 9802 / IAM 14324 / JCM 22182 / KY 12970) TaxID=764103 RepID=G7DT26_MIXOS|nr:uncharacterized protein L969DRAFT_101198 [Mixia osmundae IAM 14324]KEI42761.1 hypothetical protein L969DRAFT_101198 [Mixia osmundae IAM 14324]GAA93905.1 hypothetical protein E5Q_00551 [Mixia osmundae IAM 14324]